MPGGPARRLDRTDPHGVALIDPNRRGAPRILKVLHCAGGSVCVSKICCHTSLEFASPPPFTPFCPFSARDWYHMTPVLCSPGCKPLRLLHTADPLPTPCTSSSTLQKSDAKFDNSSYKPANHIAPLRHKLDQSGDLQREL
jgi:hypothetical protein